MATASLQTASESVDKDKVKVRVEVSEEALEGSIDAAYRRWAKEIKVPGFRKGKIPRQIIDTRVGAGAVRQDALRDALPHFYVEAMRAEDLEAIAPPDIEVVAFEPGSPLIFEATVDVRPEIILPDLDSITVEAPSAEPTDEEISEQIDRLRDRFAELETVSREVRRGDFALIDLKGYSHEELVEGASAPDLLYELGSGSGPPKLDEELEGNRPGAILRFTDRLPQGPGDVGGQEVSFIVLLKEVKARKLPPADDDFAKTAGDFETLEELKDDLRRRLADLKQQLVQDQVRSLVLEQLVQISDLDPPATLVEQEFNHRLSHLSSELEKGGLSLAQYAAHSNQTELEFRNEIRAQATRSVKGELLLEEVAREQEIQATDEEVGRDVAYIATRAERDPKEVARQLASSGRLGAVVADIMRRKALDYVVDRATVVGAGGDVDQRQREMDS
jgi:trigger factor